MCFDVVIHTMQDCPRCSEKLIRVTPDPCGTSSGTLIDPDFQAMPVKQQVTARSASNFSSSRHRPCQLSPRLLAVRLQDSASSCRQQPWLAERVALESCLPVISNAAIPACVGKDFRGSHVQLLLRLVAEGHADDGAERTVQRIRHQGGADATTRKPA